MPLTLGQAAKLAGVGKTTLTRAIRGGRLSAERRDDGSYRIDPAELARVYDVRVETPATVAATGDVAHRATGARDTDTTGETPARLAALDATVAGLQELVRRLDEQLAETRRERDAWREQTETTQRLLADRSSARAASTSSSWWRRLIRAA